MHLFAHPERLWLLLGLLPMAAWVVRGGRRRLGDWEALGQSGRPPGDGARAWMASMALVVLALGQPRWGRILGPDAPAGHDVVVLVDVSRSMGAEDAVPDRLGVAIESATSLLKALEAGPGNRAAVVAFAGRGVVRCPLTSSLGAAIDVLHALRVGEIQPGGTDLGAALESAIGAFDEEEHAEGRTIVVFSDGEDHVGSWASAIDRLRAAGIIVHSVAIGDPSRGHPLPALARPRTKKEGDSPVETRRSDVAFEALSKATGGALVPLGLVSADLGALFRDRIEPTARSRRDELRLPERVERFPAFVLGAITLGLAGSWPASRRRRGARLAFSTLAVALLSIGAGPAVETAAGLVDRGRSAYASARFAESLGAFERAIALEPIAAVPRFDAASALFQLRRYPEALARYEQARERGDAGLSLKIDYALGNTHLALGEIAEAIRCYDACLSSTLHGAAFDAVRRDATANRAFARSRLKPPTDPRESGGTNPAPATPKRPRPSPRAPNQGSGDREPSPDPSPSGEGPEGGSSSTPGGRGAGGAGGQGQAPPPVGSPPTRLDAALKDVKEARRQRLPDPPPAASGGVGKDW
jgi:Ca-activated chloride channel family protein